MLLIFPLEGSLEIHFNGNSGVKEVFPFVRAQNSNTLSLRTKLQQFLPNGSNILITAVETKAKMRHIITMIINFMQIFQ